MNCVWSWVCLCLSPGLLVLAALPAQANDAASDTCSAHNTAQQDTVTVLGQLPNTPYVVAVPVTADRADSTLDGVRHCVPDAFETRTRFGSYIRAGAFSRRSSAERLSRYLRSQRLDARVIYLP